MTSDLLKTTLVTLARHRHRVWQHASNPAVRADDSMFLQVRAAYFAVLSIACSQELISEDEMKAFEAWGRQSEPSWKLRRLFKTHGVDIENPDDPVSKSEMLQLHIKNLQAQNTRLREDLTRERGEAAAERQTYIERLAGVIQERDELRAKLERVRGLPRFVAGLGRAMWADDDGNYVRWYDIAAIIGEDGEA